MSKKPSDRFIRMYGPILEALREAGGEAPAREIMRTVADLVLGGTDERDRELKSGGNAAENEVAWSRNNLREAGLLDGSTRGIWRLTAEGWKTNLNLETGRRLGYHSQIIKRKGLEKPVPVEEQDELEFEVPQLAGPTLIETIRSLPPKGFELLCQRLLRKAGFEQVTVTGKSGDGGIDGHGVLQVNELVSFHVLFQCKRYQGSVSSGEIRNFRGAMSGRSDKGIVITTGTFTADAQREAVRDGVAPIELVDQEKLVSLMERLGLGVKPRTVYDVDNDFFEPFRLES